MIFTERFYQKAKDSKFNRKVDKMKRIKNNGGKKCAKVDVAKTIEIVVVFFFLLFRFFITCALNAQSIFVH